MRRADGFTLIELMIVVAIIGILLAIVMPSYKDMIVRARVTEGLNFMGAYKTMIAEDAIILGRLPNQAGDPANVDYYETGGSGIVRRVRWSRARSALEIWFGQDAGPELDGDIMWLVPTLLPDGSMTWKCRNHDEAAFRMEDRYLPASCR